MTSWPSSRSASGTGSSARRKRLSTVGRHGRSPKASRKRATCASGSPLAVGRKQMRGSRRGERSSTRSSRAASCGPEVKPPPPSARIRRSGGGKRAGSEIPGVQPRLGTGRDEVGAAAAPGGDDVGELVAGEVQRDPVVGGVAGRHAVVDEPAGHGPALGLGVVVHAV